MSTDRPCSTHTARLFSPIRLVLLALALIVGLLVTVRVWPIATETPPLRVAINPWPGYEFATLAAHHGLYEREGVRVRLVELGSLGDSRRAFERGQVDAMFCTLIELSQVYQSTGKLPRAVLVADASCGADVILARRGVDSVSALRGRAVAVEAGSLNEYILRRALELNNIPRDQVRLVHVEQDRMPEALAAGEVDAVVTYPPISVRMLGTGNVAEIFSTRQIPDEIIDVLAVQGPAADLRAEEINAFGRAFFAARALADQDPDAAHAFMAARQGISVPDFRAALSDGLRLVDLHEQPAFLSPGGHVDQIVQRILEQTPRPALTGVPAQEQAP